MALMVAIALTTGSGRSVQRDACGRDRNSSRGAFTRMLAIIMRALRRVIEIAGRRVACTWERSR